MAKPTASQNIFKIFFRVLSYTSRRRKWQFVFLTGIKVFVGLFESLTVVWVAGFASWIIDVDKIRTNKLYLRIEDLVPWLLPESPGELLVFGSLVLMALVAVRNGIRLLSIAFTTRYSMGIQKEIGGKIMEEILLRPYGWFISQQPSELMQIFNWRTEAGLFIHHLLTMLTELIITLSLFITLVAYNARISLPLLAGMGLLAGGINMFSKPRIHSVSKRTNTVHKSIFKNASATIGGYKDIKVLNGERFMLADLGQRLSRVQKLAEKRRVLIAVPSQLMEILSYILLTGAMVMINMGGQANMEKSLGLFAMIAITSWRMMPVVMKVLSRQSNIRGFMPVTQLILDFLDSLGEDQDRIEASESAGTEGGIGKFEDLRMEGISFRYPDSDAAVLSDLSISIAAGERVGVIGDSGSGKTTLVDIVSGLLEPSSGRLLVNGGPIDGAVAGAWRNHIGYLPQKPYIFLGSIEKNVALSERGGEADSGRVKAIISSLGMTDVERRLTGDGAELGERGMNLSGGQAQRIALARLLYADRDFIIVDEGTSALDEASEESVLEQLFADPERTVILITHRIESLSGCDRILWLQDGAIRMDGDPKDVIDAYRADAATIRSP